MALTTAETGRRNSKLTYQLCAWTIQDGTGESFDSPTMFTLPNGAEISPTPLGFARSVMKLSRRSSGIALPPSARISSSS